MYQLNSEESSRIEIMRVICALFVLWIHAYFPQLQVSGGLRVLYTGSYMLGKKICDCAVPVFICISSILLYRKPFTRGDNIRKKIKALLIPYLIFNSLWIVMQCVKYYVLKVGMDSESPDYAQFTAFQWIAAYTGSAATNYKPALTLLWYVRDLFILNIFALNIKKLVDRYPIAVAVLTIAYWFSSFPSAFFQRYSVCFFIFGCFIVKYDVHLSELDKINPIGLAFAYLGLFAADIMTELPIVHKLFVMISLIAVAYCSKYFLSQNGLFQKLSQSTYFVYLSHRFVYNIILVILPKADGWRVVYFYIAPLCTFAICHITYCLLRKYFPGLCQILTGSRVYHGNAKLH